MTRVIDRPVLVLNRSWEPVAVFDVATAITTVVRGMGAVVDPEIMLTYDFESWVALDSPAAARIPTPSGSVPAPEVITLAQFAQVPNRRVSFSREALHRRDGGRCQYCGVTPPRGERLTIDHVQPRSRGGPTSWENCVLACAACNRDKADRTPREAGMTLRTRPTRPRWTPGLFLQREQVRPSWTRFVQQVS